MFKMIWDEYQVANLLAMLVHSGHDPAEFFTRREHMIFVGEIMLSRRASYNHHNPIVQSFLSHPDCCDYMIEAVYLVIKEDFPRLLRVLNAESLVYFEYRPPCEG